MKIITGVILILTFLTPCKDSDIAIDHPLVEHVPVAFGTSLEDCKKVFPGFFETNTNEHYPFYTYEYPTYMIDIEPKNTIIRDGLNVLGFYALGFENDKLAKITFHCAHVITSSTDVRRGENTFDKASAICCEKFLDCDKFYFPNTIETNKWKKLSTSQYDIKLRIDYPGRNQFIYEVELKK